MQIIRIHKGRDIPLDGAAEKKILPLALPDRVAIQPQDFPGLRLRLVVREQDDVLVGTPLLVDRTDPRIRVVSPVSGRVGGISRGERRAVRRVEILPDGEQRAEPFACLAAAGLASVPRALLIEQLLASGVWPCLRQRPFSRVADPEARPRAIFVQALNTEPLALDTELVLAGQEQRFQTGLEILRRLTDGPVHVYCSARATALTGLRGVEVYGLAGPHPAGNVSTAIQAIDPLKKGETLWYLEAQDVLRIAALFLDGRFSPERVVAVTGTGAAQRIYRRTVLGCPAADLAGGPIADGMRTISGSVLRGTDIGPEGYLCFYDSQLTILPAGGRRRVLGWLRPGARRFSLSAAFLSSWLPRRQGERVALDTGLQGSARAIVLNHLYDDYVALDVLPFFLLRAVLSGDLEEAERLGLLECDEEDFALCAFACPSKTDVGAIIRRGLDQLAAEG